MVVVEVVHGGHDVAGDETPGNAAGPAGRELKPAGWRQIQQVRVKASRLEAKSAGACQSQQEGVKASRLETKPAKGSQSQHQEFRAAGECGHKFQLLGSRQGGPWGPSKKKGCRVSLRGLGIIMISYGRHC
eukprot:1136893-Pelagomonas_calceolata.AAC.9